MTKRREEVNPNPKPMFYAVLLQRFREIALAHGYALAVHGSMASDMDLLAVPWVEEVSEPLELAKAFLEEMGTTVWKIEDFETVFPPEEKPHNRLAFSIPIIGDYFIDLSIIKPNGIK